MTSNQHIKEYNEGLLSHRYEVMARVVESLGVWECLAPTVSTSSNSFQDTVNNSSAQEWIRQKHLNKCTKGEKSSIAMGCSGNKRNCHGITTNTHLSLNRELSAKEQQKHQTHVLLKHLHRDDNNILGGALIRLPAMQLDDPDDDDKNTSSQEENLNNGPRHPYDNMNENKTSSLDSIQPPKPKMQASVLHILEHASPHSSSSNLLDVSRSPEYLRQLGPSVSKQLEESAYINLGRPLSFTRTSAPHAPVVLLHSLSSSFSSLIQSHIKSWTILLLRQSLKSGDETSRKHLLKLLSIQNDVSINAMVTEFILEEYQIDYTSNLLDQALKRRESRIKKLNEDGENESLFQMDYCDLILPFVFKIAMDVSLYDEEVTVHFNSPGMCGAIFHEDSEKITYLECKVNTETLMKSMVEQIRLIVSQAVTKVTTAPEQVLKSSITIPQAINIGKSLTKLGTTGSAFSTIETKAMTVPLPIQNERLSERNDLISSTSKQRISDYREVFKSLSTDHTIVPEEEPPSLLRQPGSKKGLYTERSVQWDTDVKSVAPTYQVQKRTRQNGSIISRMVRSSKSFGRPGPDAFEPLRNATFSDFGHVSRSLSKKNTYMQNPTKLYSNILQKNDSSPRKITTHSNLNLKDATSPLKCHRLSSLSHLNNNQPNQDM